MTDVIIPAYKPDKELLDIIDRLSDQTLKPHKIIIINTGRKYLDDLLSSTGYKPDESLVEIHHIDEEQFDHGGTRAMAVKLSDADVFVCMTQDAVPADDDFLENLTAPLSDEGIAVSYARQLAKEDASVEERLTRQFNYPDISALKSAGDLQALGIKTYFCSNVSCAYRKDVYEKLGGFIQKTIFNEDMIYAAAVIKAGYKIAYSADAKVYHSHDYTAGQQFKRNVDIGISQAEHPEVFEGLSSESEGKKLVTKTVKELKKSGNALRVPGYIWMIACRYAGFLIGKNHKHLPKGFVKMCSMNRRYFE